MSTPDKIYPLNIASGIQRDGTPFLSRKWTDGVWVRFYMGLPQKMGGYSRITHYNTAPRGIYLINDPPLFDVYIGEAEALSFFTMNSSGVRQGSIVDRTPGEFQESEDNMWMFDTMFSTTDEGSVLIAHAAPNLSSISSEVETQVWFGESKVNNDDDAPPSPLIATAFSVSGGIVVLHPFLFAFGSNGYVSWSQPNNPRAILGSSRVTAQKIVAGYATRGGNSSPAGLLWSLDALIRVTQTGATDEPSFTFDTITNDTSILSSNCVVEYDGVYFWIGIDRFLYYQGTVQELKNTTNLKYFFSNLNMAQRQKVWGTKYTKYGEIWWFFPSGNSVECNHAIIYNLREDEWYDTPISRCCGYYEQTFARPIWCDSEIDSSDNGYIIWQHEIGVDKNIRNVLTSIPSWIKSGSLAWVATGPDSQRNNLDRWVYLYRLEPDFIQEGNIILQVDTKEYARSPIVSSSVYFSQLTDESFQSVSAANFMTWGVYAFGKNDEKVDLRVQGREMTILFYSDVVGGNFEMGQVLIVGRIGDGRQ